MSKISTIIKREYLSRVKKKTFLLTTILLPVIFLGGSVLIGFLTASSKQDFKLAVVDESKIFEQKLWDSSKSKVITYLAVSKLDSIKTNYEAKGYDAVMHIKPLANNRLDTNSITIYTDGTLGLETTSYLEDRLNSVYQSKLLSDNGMSISAIDSIDAIDVKFNTETKDKNSVSTTVASSIAGFCGFLLYLTLFIYGMMVMRGVMEEKTNRIAEVIVSSVKPFELMMGKVIGIGLVGLTQFLIWAVLIGVIGSIFGTMYAVNSISPDQLTQVQGAAKIASKSDAVSGIFSTLSSINWLKIGGCFIFYFLGGYLLYASLFAAVGSLVDEDVSDAQGFTTPITLPIIIAFIIATQAVNDPNSGLAVAASIFPLTSPLVMMARLPFNPPVWQIIASMLCLVLAFWGAVWVAGKIYRQGILMYGKKLKWKDVFSFFKMK
jgi:ABC-2 type transport system permease protein